MDISKISAGIDPPRDINVIIEISQGGPPIKYEFDKDSGALVLDRFLHTSMMYPANYGFIPHTLSADGDPCDALVVSHIPIMPGAVVRCRPIGVLLMEDENGKDEKILTVPVDKLHPFYTDVQRYGDLPKILLQQIEHFFARYKDLETGKWAAIVKWAGTESAEDIIRLGLENVALKIK